MRKRFKSRLARTAGVSLILGAAVLPAARTSFANMPALSPVGDAGNPADATGWGAVADAYRIGTFEITRSEYAAFLNATAATDTYALYNPAMGIVRSGEPGGYTYAAPDGQKPVAHVSWYDALRFANWLHNGQPEGGQTAATTEDGAYTFSGATAVGPRNEGARFFLPSEDEWYKAAYYRGGSDGSYWRYPTRSDRAPIAIVRADDANTANYDNVSGGVSEVGAFAATPGLYGTYDQAGNLWEWNEKAIDGDRGIRGGSHDDYELLLNSWYRDSQQPASENEFVGFRIAAAAVSDPGDTDGDGLPDAWELEFFADLPAEGAAADPDHDGHSNSQEYVAGTDPTDAQSVFRVVELARGNETLSIRWLSAPNRTYRLDRLTDLTRADFTIAASNVAATPPVNTYTVPVTGPGAVFYRVLTEPLE